MDAYHDIKRQPFVKVSQDSSFRKSQDESALFDPVEKKKFSSSFEDFMFMPKSLDADSTYSGHASADNSPFSKDDSCKKYCNLRGSVHKSSSDECPLPKNTVLQNKFSSHENEHQLAADQSDTVFSDSGKTRSSIGSDSDCTQLGPSTFFHNCSQEANIEDLAHKNSYSLDFYYKNRKNYTNITAYNETDSGFDMGSRMEEEVSKPLCVDDIKFTLKYRSRSDESLLKDNPLSVLLVSGRGGKSYCSFDVSEDDEVEKGEDDSFLLDSVCSGHSHCLADFDSNSYTVSTPLPSSQLHVREQEEEEGVVRGQEGVVRGQEEVVRGQEGVVATSTDAAVLDTSALTKTSPEQIASLHHAPTQCQASSFNTSTDLSTPSPDTSITTPLSRVKIRSKSIDSKETFQLSCKNSSFLKRKSSSGLLIDRASQSPEEMLRGQRHHSPTHRQASSLNTSADLSTPCPDASITTPISRRKMMRSKSIDSKETIQLIRKNSIFSKRKSSAEPMLFGMASQSPEEMLQQLKMASSGCCRGVCSCDAVRSVLYDETPNTEQDNHKLSLKAEPSHLE